MPVAAGIAYAEHRGGAPASGRPPLVLIHGAASSRLVWPPQLRRLAGARVLALDLPGHGRSGGSSERTIDAYLRRVFDWVQAVGLDRALLAGHSMGGAIALLAALTMPEQVAGMVLLSSGARLRVDPELLQALRDERTYRSILDSINLLWFGPDAPARLVELSRQRLADVPPEVALDDFLACDSFDVMDRLGEIQTPALVLCGLEDQMTPEKYSRHLAYQIPNSTLEFIPGAGHMALLEQPQAVTEAVQRFLDATFGAPVGPG